MQAISLRSDKETIFQSQYSTGGEGIHFTPNTLENPEESGKESTDPSLEKLLSVKVNQCYSG
jgi:hypothetical protein